MNLRSPMARVQRVRRGVPSWPLLGVALLLNGLAACVPGTAPKSADDTRVMGGIAGVRVELGAITRQPGLAEYELQVAGQGSRSIEVWMPEALRPEALIIFLHGAVAPAHAESHHVQAKDRSRGLVSCLAAPGLAALNPLIIAPRSPTGQWWSRSDTEFVLGLVLAVRERWPAAGDHAVIAGYSNGGIGAWYFARLYPDYFRAAVPMAFSDSIVGETKLPVYGIEGTKDELFDFESVRAAVEAQRAKGHDVTLKEKYRGTHLAPCSYVPELSSAAQWLETRVFQHSGAPE